ncbi:cytochrome-c peroxidase [uncultured Aquimarina sp.]|uniref:cytochrome-c peroxidase n=1 Tax=uncultured Aquimarina sp. TaxID=575652 RepID=UPI0026153C4D|nr:cytochrome-c peroxidase [uncultured Aquimarina sp.]
MKAPKYVSKTLFIVIFFQFLLHSCKSDDGYISIESEDEEISTELSVLISDYFGNSIDFNGLANYENQEIPAYITKDNTAANVITDEKATLGRILFYDKNLSVDNTISCASCHQQAFAFGDQVAVSQGVNGATGRHSMRLINSRFSDEVRFFWDERAATLEQQTTQPIQDHAEMGFSGQDGDPSLNDLLAKLADTEYYPVIFEHVYGDLQITETRLQESIAQFIRSIQSFDSRFDQGLSQTNNINQNFPNFTTQENQGKRLFMDPPNQGGAGCMGCHRAPEFDIDPRSLNNGVIGVFGDISVTDEKVTRAPTLRDVFGPNGLLNGNLMHDAGKASMIEVVEHYNAIDATGNTNLDPRLRGDPGQNGQQLNLTETEMEAIEFFMKTLTGNDVYANEKWSNPFLSN